MGILDRWTKKQIEEKLDEQKGDAAPAEKPAPKKTAKKAKAAEAPQDTKKAAVYGIAHRVLVRPLVTEKSAHQEGVGKYTFVVHKNASKLDIKRAVKELYGVMPARVTVAHVQGRYVRFGRSMGRRSDYKKAVVTLPKGSTITIHEGV
jgi:large subunit ribosomal protein L23